MKKRPIKIKPGQVTMLRQCDSRHCRDAPYTVHIEDKDGDFACTSCGQVNYLGGKLNEKM